MVFTARRDTQTRLDDYKKALKLWLGCDMVEHLVLVENSGFDLSELEVLAAQVPGKKVELLSFTAAEFDGSLGKGYGEMLCLKHCLEHSQLLARSSRFLKITGRYFTTNASPLLNFITLRKDADIICDMRRNLKWADSRAFGGSREFLRDYLCPMLDQLNDSTGSTFEHVLARAAHYAMAEHGLWVPPPFPLGIEGTSATRGHVWEIGFWETVKDRLRQALLAKTLSSGPK